MTYALGNLSNRFIQILLFPIYTRVFAPSEYGVVEVLSVFAALVGLLAELGLDQAVARYFVDSDDPRERCNVALTGLAAGMGVALPVTAALLLGAGPLARLLLGEPAHAGCVRLVVLTVPFTLLYSTASRILRYTFRSIAYTALSMSLLLVQTALTILLVVVLRWGLLGVFVSILGAKAAFSTLALWTSRRWFKGQWSWDALRRLAAFGVPLMANGLASYLLGFTDRYLLGWLAGPAAVGLFGAATKLPALMSILTMGFNQAWVPFVFATYREPQSPWRYRRIFDWYAVMVAVGVAGVSLLTPEALRLAVGRAYWGVYNVVPVLLFASAAMMVGSYFQIGIWIVKKPYHTAWISAVSAALCIGLNRLFIPRWGIYGAAVSALIADAVRAVGLLVFSQRYYRVPLRLGRMAVLWATTGALIAGTLWLFGGRVGVWIVAIKLLVVGVVAVVAIAVGLIRARDLDLIREIVSGMSRGRKRVEEETTP